MQRPPVHAQQTSLAVLALQEEVRGALGTPQLRLEAEPLESTGGLLDEGRTAGRRPQLTLQGGREERREFRLQRVEDDEALAAEQAVHEPREHVRPAAALRAPHELAHARDVLGWGAEAVQHVLDRA